MTSPGPAVAPQAEKIGPGRLILVVGPSGAGKDTLIGFVKAACRTDSTIVFPRRIVTREASSFEDNDCISTTDFDNAVSNGRFSLHWQAHGLQYALPGSMLSDICTGRTVVANVSRTVVARLRDLYQSVTVVLVTAPPDVRAARLVGRARTSDGNITDRLERAVDVHPDAIIHNVGPIDQNGRDLMQIVTGER
ncbi:MAG: phosphonate metabolism protein/1,5-bisphosphokinase (PRPP-forming) PhnN [Xanthobacteraceae bacterium]|nr:phosphonate metabolism protein/1,5-bisphosphokinase (PRPP-forming) PhnN [Xanthobacteraceae bacterium]